MLRQIEGLEDLQVAPRRGIPELDRNEAGNKVGLRDFVTDDTSAITRS